MNLHAILLAIRDFTRSADKMPDGPKLFLLTLLVVASSACYIAGKTLDNAPAILRAAPPAIRALREQPTKPVAEIQPDTIKGQVNR